MVLAGKELGKYVGYCIGLDRAPDVIKYVLLSLLFMVNVDGWCKSSQMHLGRGSAILYVLKLLVALIDVRRRLRAHSIDLTPPLTIPWDTRLCWLVTARLQLFRHGSIPHQHHSPSLRLPQGQVVCSLDRRETPYRPSRQSKMLPPRQRFHPRTDLIWI
jgi:hypothetical protein